MAPQCQLCLQIFSEDRSLYRHDRYSCPSRIKQRYSCYFGCEKSFSRNDILDRHVREQHLGLGNPNRTSKKHKAASGAFNELDSDVNTDGLLQTGDTYEPISESNAKRYIQPQTEVGPGQQTDSPDGAARSEHTSPSTSTSDGTSTRLRASVSSTTSVSNSAPVKVDRTTSYISDDFDTVDGYQRTDTSSRDDTTSFNIDDWIDPALYKDHLEEAALSDPEVDRRIKRKQPEAVSESGSEHSSGHAGPRGEGPSPSLRSSRYCKKVPRKSVATNPGQAAVGGASLQASEDEQYTQRAEKGPREAIHSSLTAAGPYQRAVRSSSDSRMPVLANPIDDLDIRQMSNALQAMHFESESSSASVAQARSEEEAEPFDDSGSSSREPTECADPPIAALPRPRGRDRANTGLEQHARLQRSENGRRDTLAGAASIGQDTGGLRPPPRHAFSGLLPETRSYSMDRWESERHRGDAPWTPVGVPGR